MTEAFPKVEVHEHDIRTVGYGVCIVAEAGYKEPLLKLLPPQEIQERIRHINSVLIDSGSDIVGFGLLRPEPNLTWPNRGTISIVGIGLSKGEFGRPDLSSRHTDNIIDTAETHEFAMLRFIGTQSQRASWLGGRVADESLAIMAAFVDKSVSKLGRNIVIWLSNMPEEDKGMQLIVMKK